MRTTKITLAAAVAVLALSGCGAMGVSAPSSSAPSSSASVAPGAGPTAAPSSSASAAPTTECTAADVKVTGAFGAKPEVTIPDTCAPPTKLVVKDLSKGTGKQAAEGSTVLTNYLLVTWSDKKVLDTSFGRAPYPVQNLGHAQVIDGWNEGMIGIKQGGRRLMIIPPDKAYGQGGNGIAPNETLAFVVDAVKVT